MEVSVSSTAFHVFVLEKRMPFHFGNVEVSADPQVFLRIEASIEGRKQAGIAMGGLVAPWFYKDPDMQPAEGYRNMIDTFRSAAEVARTLDPEPTPFAFWQALYRRQRNWARGTDHPPLLWTYGVSLVEQAIIDAVCRNLDASFAAAVRDGRLGIDLGAFYDELAAADPSALLPDDPRPSTAIRHTVGLEDPLTSDDVSPSERLDDGLPQTLAEYVREDGVTHFKIKLSADRRADADRLSRIADVLADLGVDEYVCTLDANEGFGSAREFRRQWESHEGDRNLQSILERVAYVEQPLAREDALTAETKAVFDGWDDAPPVIIDESDRFPDSAGEALAYGYAGTSHKNCKGVFKGVANACLIAHRNRTDPDRQYVISAEDLTTVGPVELLQDFATTATIGVPHVERNGHHYFRGLSAFPEDVQEAVLDAHGDLYRRHEDGFATLDVDAGTVELGSVVDAPFGVAPLFDTDRFIPLDEWLDRLGR